MIGLADMIRQAGECSSQQKKTGDRKLEQLRKIAGDRHEQAKEAYKSVMVGNGWMTTPVIEKSMGYKHGSCNTSLKKFVKDGVVEKRPLNGEPFSRRRGWEYRWIEESQDD